MSIPFATASSEHEAQRPGYKAWHLLCEKDICKIKNKRGTNNKICTSHAMIYKPLLCHVSFSLLYINNIITPIEPPNNEAIHNFMDTFCEKTII